MNADDFGLTARTSEAIVRLHEEGVVTSTSALVLAPGFGPAAPMIADHPTLGVGAHLCLVGPDRPLCPARSIPTLVDRRGRLAPSWHLLWPRLAAGRVDPDDIRRELEAQIRLAREAGLRLTHLDSHQHLHLWPIVADVVIDLARRHGIGALRCPESRSWKTERPPVTAMSYRLRRRIAAAGLRTTDRFAGLDESGKAVADRFDKVLARVPTGVTSFEFAVHPNGGPDPDLARYSWGRRGAEEAAGLSRPGLAARLSDEGWRLASFAALSPPPTSGPPPALDPTTPSGITPAGTAHP